MKLSNFRSALAVVVASGALMASGPASAIIVGGVDFGTPGTTHLETSTLAETIVNGDNQEIFGYGQVNTVNGNLIYAGTNRLYFYFYDYETIDFTPASTGFTGGIIDVYLGPTINLLNQSSTDNITTITGYTPWVRLLGESSLVNGADIYTLFANGQLTGSVLAFVGSGLLSTDTSGAFGIQEVWEFLDPNDIATGLGTFADIALTSSGDNEVLNVNDDTTGCQDGTAAVGTWCLAGSADLRGSTVQQVPEPSSLALLGLALAGLGAASRRRKAT